MNPGADYRAILAFTLSLATFLPREVGAMDGPKPLPLAPVRPGAESGPTKISIGAWFADISRIDSVADTFSANLVLMLRWHDPRLAHTGPGIITYPIAEIWYPRWLIANEGESLKRSLPEVVEVAPDGSVVYRQRLLGPPRKLSLFRIGG